MSVEIIAIKPDPGVSSTATPLYAAMRPVVLKHYPDAIVTPMIDSHGIDSEVLHARGVIEYGFTPMILDTDTAATMHSDHAQRPCTATRSVFPLPSSSKAFISSMTYLHPSSRPIDLGWPRPLGSVSRAAGTILGAAIQKTPLMQANHQMEPTRLTERAAVSGLIWSVSGKQSEEDVV